MERLVLESYIVKTTPSISNSGLRRAKAKKETGKEKAAEEKAAQETMVKITMVEPNRKQPRKNFDEDALLQLFYIPHTEFFIKYLLCQCILFLRIFNRQQSSGMSRTQHIRTLKKN